MLGSTMSMFLAFLRSNDKIMTPLAMPLNTHQKMKMKSRERDIEAKPNEAEVIAQF